MRITQPTSTTFSRWLSWARGLALPGLGQLSFFQNAGGLFTRLSSFMLRLRHWPLLLFCLALGLRLAGIAVDPFWYDENFTISIIHLPLDRMIMGAVGDVHPPLYYVIAWALGHVAGYSPLIMRLPSALFGSWACVELYLVMRGLGEGEARTGSVIMAVLPAMLNYGQETRSYALLLALILFTFRSVQEGKWKRATLAAALVLWTHSMGAFYLASIGVMALLKNWKAAIRMYTTAGLTLIPWLPAYLRQIGHIDGGYWIAPPQLGALPYALWYDTLFNRWPPALAFHAEIATIGLTVMGGVMALRTWRKSLPLLWLAGAPPLLIFGVSNLWQSVFREPAMLTSGAAAAGLWGIGIARLKGWDRGAALLIAVPTLLASLVGYYSSNPMFDWRHITDIIRRDWQSGDVIYHMNVASYIQVDQADDFRGKNYLLPGSNDLSQNMTDETKDALGIQRAELATLRDGGQQRVWFIYIQQPLTNEREAAFGQRVTTQYKVLAEYDVYKTPLSDFRLYLLDVSDD